MENEEFQEFVVKHLMNLTEKTSSMDGKITSMQSDISSIKGDVTSLKSTVLRIETRIENEIIGKINILFDGHQLHENRLDRVEKKMGIII